MIWPENKFSAGYILPDITKTAYATRLVASGGAARWKRVGQFVLYTAGIRALACLENVVHRSGEGLTANFRVMVIDVPDSLAIELFSIRALNYTSLSGR